MNGQTVPYRMLSCLHPMIYFRAEGVVNYDTLVYGVVRSEIGPTLEDGVAIYHPIEQYGFHQKGFLSAPLTQNDSYGVSSFQIELEFRIFTL